MSRVEHLLSVQNVAGESPIWVAAEESLCWVDCEGARAYRVGLGKAAWETFDADMPVTAICPRAKGGWIAATKKGLAFWDGRGGHFEPIVDPEAGHDGHRCNDAAIDRRGRLWVGTMNQKDLSAPTGSLWRLDADLSLHKIDTGFAVPNGIAFSGDGRTMYVTDMFHGKIVAYDFNLADGTVSNQRDFAAVPQDAGLPDGLIADAEGCLWSAHWGGWRVTRYRPDGKIDRVVKLPAANVTCMAFGGKELDELYITTAFFGLTDEQRKQQPQAGDLFRALPGVRGVAEPQFAG
jgi:sugar lactone lactonase YvrE